MSGISALKNIEKNEKCYHKGYWKESDVNAEVVSEGYSKDVLSNDSITVRSIQSHKEKTLKAATLVRIYKFWYAC